MAGQRRPGDEQGRTGGDEPLVDVQEAPGRDHRGDHRLGEPDLPEARVEDARDAVPPERLAEAEAACVSALQDDPGERDEAEERGPDTDDQQEPPPERGRGRAEGRRQGDRPSRHQQEQCEIEEADDGEEDVDAPRGPPAEDLARDPLRVRAGLQHMEDERSGDGMRVLRDHAPGDRVGAAGERAVDPDAHRPWGRPLDLPVVDPRRVRVVDPDRPEGALDRLVELAGRPTSEKPPVGRRWRVGSRAASRALPPRARRRAP